MQTQSALRDPQTIDTPVAPAVAQSNAAATVLEFPLLERSVDEADASAGLAVHKDMHPGVYTTALFTWAAFMAVFWLTFWMSGNALFMVTIGTAYAIMFFGVPYMMSRVSPSQKLPEHGLVHFLRGKVDTLYGPMSSIEALIQVVLVPAALTLGGIAIAFAIHSAKAAY